MPKLMLKPKKDEAKEPAPKVEAQGYPPMGKKALEASTAPSGATAALLKSFKKEYGDAAGSFGGNFVNSERIPTGIFEFDLATGGGFPRGRCSIIYGPESSCKTNLAYLAIAWHQLLWPDLVCSFVDVEHSFDPAYAKKFGVNVDKLMVLEPLLAEQAVDMVEALLAAEDCGLVVVDSLAALVTTGEFNNSAEKAVVGGSSNPIGKLYRKSSRAMGEASSAGRSPTLLYINQVRHKIGVMFGDPETMPGGNAPKFQASLWIRVYGKNIIDNKINQDLPVRKNVKVVIKKWKVPIFSVNAEFEMATIAHNGLKVGQSDSSKLIKTLLEGMGEYNKAEGKGGGWNILGTNYPTQAAFEEHLLNNHTFANTLKKSLIDDSINKTLIAAEGDLGV
ncbi:recombinase protein [Rhizobium phage RHph_Y1_11]|nr:recombinase protein [Rhizobium phage RHph_Y1_11]